LSVVDSLQTATLLKPPRLLREKLTSLLQFAVVILELVLVGGVLSAYSWNIANQALQDVILLAFGGVIVHHFLPVALRMSFFAGLSVASILLVFGIGQGAWLLSVGLVLMLTCHLPVSMRLRVLLLAAISVGLMVMRAYWPDWNGLSAIWPILGSMFMFRLLVYLYDLSTKNAPFSPARSLAYFFMLPNVCFPLFPVVDYKTFCLSHGAEDPFRGYQTGVRWILRGAVQLILYRVVYQLVMNDPAEIQSGGELFRYMISTYLLYLHISGNFHLIIGILHLYGFNLPETHHRWLLASSFLDFWRRINIYWKDFIMKVVFYPLYFRIRRIGHERAMLLAAALAFVATWALHSYQWFWIRGSFLIASQDIAFWTILGLLVVANMWLDMRRKGKRAIAATGSEPRFGVALLTGLKTMATFTAIAVLWSMWTSESLSHWFVTLGSARQWGADDVLFIAAILAVVGVAGAFWGYSSREWSTPERAGSAAASSAQAFNFWRSAAVAIASSVLIFALGRPEVHWQIGQELAQSLEPVRSDSLNQQDAKILERGYYEELTNTLRFSPALWEVFNKEPAGWRGTSPVDESFNPGWVKQLHPSLQTTFKGGALSTNTWGMRGREYALEKPANTYRVVLAGDSHTMGTGVNDDQVYASVLEERLNREPPRAGVGYEVLNFAVAGSGPWQKLATLEERALRFQPDAIVYAGTDLFEFKWAIRDLARAVSYGQPIPFPELTAIAKEAGVHGQLLPEPVVAYRLRPYAEKMLSALYDRLAARCNEVGADCYFLLVANTFSLTEDQQKTVDETVALARRSGLTVLDLTQAYAGVASVKDLWITAWDNHPNQDGHRLLADLMYDQLVPLVRDSQPDTTPPLPSH
jgi:lysophospholipase L1-like esterase